MLSRLCESEPLIDIQRQRLLQGGQERGAQQRSAPVAQLRLPWMVLISPLCGEVAIGVCEAPLRQRVGGEALMEHGHRALEAWIGEIRIELRQILRHHHALNDDGAGRETRT